MKNFLALKILRLAIAYLYKTNKNSKIVFQWFICKIKNIWDLVNMLTAKIISYEVFFRWCISKCHKKYFYFNFKKNSYSSVVTAPWLQLRPLRLRIFILSIFRDHNACWHRIIAFYQSLVIVKWLHYQYLLNSSDLNWCLFLVLVSKFGDCSPCWKRVIVFYQIHLSFRYLHYAYFSN